MRNPLSAIVQCADVCATNQAELRSPVLILQEHHICPQKL
jgi:hypothetical protein